MSAPIALLQRAQRAAERLMTDTCKVERATDTALDPATLAEVPTYSTIYDGPCRVQTNAGRVYRPEVGEQAINVTRQILQLPVTATGVAVDDVVTLTAAGDAALVGVRLVVIEVEHKSDATMHRFTVEERQA